MTRLVHVFPSEPNGITHYPPGASVPQKPLGPFSWPIAELPLFLNWITVKTR